MSKFYVYRGFNQYDGLCGESESKEEAQQIIQAEMKEGYVCELSDIYEFDCEEAYESSRLFTEICEG